jgi:hypothetical protein
MTPLRTIALTTAVALPLGVLISQVLPPWRENAAKVRRECIAFVDALTENPTISPHELHWRTSRPLQTTNEPGKRYLAGIGTRYGEPASSFSAGCGNRNGAKRRQDLARLLEGPGNGNYE